MKTLRSFLTGITYLGAAALLAFLILMLFTDEPVMVEESEVQKEKNREDYKREVDFNQRYFAGARALEKGDSISVFVNWGSIAVNYDSSFYDSLKKYHIREYLLNE